MAALVATHGLPTTLLANSIAARGQDVFVSLARSVAYQQLSTKAANTIWARVVDALGGEATLTPAAVLRTPAETLRAAGLSGRKVEYLHGLANAFAEGRMSGERLAQLSDAEAEAALTQLRGFGAWSAHMCLIFGYCRADVLPWGDYGVRKAYRQLYGGGRGAKDLPSRAELETAAAAWAPNRSLVAWYLWRALDATPAPAT